MNILCGMKPSAKRSSCHPRGLQIGDVCSSAEGDDILMYRYWACMMEAVAHHTHSLICLLVKSQGSKSRIEIKWWNCDWRQLHVWNSSDLLRTKIWPPKGKSNTGKPTTKDIKLVQRLLGFINSERIFFFWWVSDVCEFLWQLLGRDACWKSVPQYDMLYPARQKAEDHIRCASQFIIQLTPLESRRVTNIFIRCFLS